MVSAKQAVMYAATHVPKHNAPVLPKVVMLVAPFWFQVPPRPLKNTPELRRRTDPMVSGKQAAICGSQQLPPHAYAVHLAPPLLYRWILLLGCCWR
jgi:hypothetical protein